MKKSRFTEEKILEILKQGQMGMSVADLCRQNGVSRHTYYVWRSKYSGMTASDAKRLRELEDENRRLKRIVGDQALDIAALKEAMSKKW
jgi:putative transposase